MSLTGLALTVSVPLAPSLTPAAQPTISLLSDTNTDSLSVDSLTLLPPADPPFLRRFSRDEAAPAGPDTRTTPNLQGAGDRKDVSASLEPHHPDSEPAKVSEPDLTSRSREKVGSEISAPDPEDNLDLEQETEID
ncbi:protein CLEC16A isoform X1 [Tachysurus ichikawai]